MKVVYQGPHRQVIVADGVFCDRGEPADVSDELGQVLVLRSDFEPAPDGRDDTPKFPAIARLTVDDVIEWVDGDAAKARQALEAEQHRPDGPRVTLTDQLDAIINDDGKE